MELRRYLAIARHRLLLIILIVLAGIVGAYFITPRQSQYAATTTIYVGPKTLALNQPGVANAGTTGYDRFIATFVQMIQTLKIAGEAQASLKIDRSPKTILQEISATQAPGTNLLEITATDPDASLAQKLSTAVAQEFIQEANSVSAGNDAAAYLTIVQPATLPTTPLSNGLIKNLLLGFALGIVVAGITVAVVEYMDITLRNADDVERKLNLRVLSVIPSLGEQFPTTPVAGVQRSTQPPANGAAPLGEPQLEGEADRG